MLDKVIALDSSASSIGRICGVAMRYRKAVLEPGGSKPGELVIRFMQPQQNLDAFKEWMDEEFEDPAK